MQTRLLFTVFMMHAFSARAEKFDIFLDSLSQNLPMKTQYMKSVLKNRGTRLANPSLLEKWGVINQDAVATYNSILNTVVLNQDYTVDEPLANGKKKLRAKSWSEMQATVPNVWPIRLATIFHELSHAEFSWLTRSTESVDRELLNFLKSDFDGYLKMKYPKASASQRTIAQSELFAYYRDNLFTLLLETKNEIALENGYFSSSQRCRKTEFLEKWFRAHPELDSTLYAVTGRNLEFSQMPLPTVYVKGAEFIIDPKDAIYSSLQDVLWRQWQHHFAPSRSKSEVAQWMNTQPALLNWIKSCRPLN